MGAEHQICECCKRPFIPNMRRLQRYCSMGCADKGRADRRAAAERAEKQAAREAARAQETELELQIQRLQARRRFTAEIFGTSF